MNHDEKTPPTGPRSARASSHPGEAIVTKTPHPRPPGVPSATSETPTPRLTGTLAQQVDAAKAELRGEVEVRLVKQQNLDRTILSRFAERIEAAEHSGTTARAESNIAREKATGIESAFRRHRIALGILAGLLVMLAGFAFAGARRVARLTDRVEQLELARDPQRISAP